MPGYVNYHCRMRELTLDGAALKTRDDVYNSFFRAVGTPDWHGRNFDALRDSIATVPSTPWECLTG
ncbi:MAG TPA: barstar family protein [Terriglobales bacterium]|nr:barstar family protein [Terriglobales bacterium]